MCVLPVSACRPTFLGRIDKISYYYIGMFPCGSYGPVSAVRDKPPVNTLPPAAHGRVRLKRSWSLLCAASAAAMCHPYRSNPHVSCAEPYGMRRRGKDGLPPNPPRLPTPTSAAHERISSKYPVSRLCAASPTAVRLRRSTWIFSATPSASVLNHGDGAVSTRSQTALR